MGRNKRTRKKQEEYFFDYALLFIVLFLLVFGLVMLYSVSSYEAGLDYGDSAFYLKKQATATSLGLVIMFVIACIDYHFWEKFASFGYLASVVCILLVKSPIGKTTKGASRWILIGPISIQPAEIAKLAMILFLAVVVCKMGKKIRTWEGLIALILMPVPIAALIKVVTNNLSSAIIVMGIAVLMIFVATPQYKRYVLFALIGIVAVIGIVFYIKVSAAEGTGFRGARVLAWLDPQAYASDTGFQTLQALYAIGSGGLWGKGLGRSMQKLGFLPEAQNDMIFSIICEELGLFGAFAIIMLFVILLWRFMVIANNASDLLGALLVVGVMGHIAIQVILNIAVVTNTMPNTGISLPFISYGGTSIVFLLGEIGLALSVSRGIRLKDVG